VFALVLALRPEFTNAAPLTAHFEHALGRLRFEGVRDRKIFRGGVAGHVDVSLAVEGHGGGGIDAAAGQHLMADQHLAAGMNRTR
jgi:hypothetical protein